MASQPFEVLIEDRGLEHGSLLRTVEHLVVESHAALHRDLLGEPWSAPAAYRWIRYENPDPVARLLAASEALEQDWAGVDPGSTVAPAEFRLLHEATTVAAALGYKG